MVTVMSVYAELENCSRICNRFVKLFYRALKFPYYLFVLLCYRRTQHRKVAELRQNWDMELASLYLSLQQKNLL